LGNEAGGINEVGGEFDRASAGVWVDLVEGDGAGCGKLGAGVNVVGAVIWRKWLFGES